jgi:hypothetical protein
MLGVSVSLAASRCDRRERCHDLIETKGQELDKSEMNTQLGAYKIEPNPEGDSQRR